MTIKVKESLDKAISVLEFIAPLTQITIDDEFLAAAKAVQQSPALISYIQSKLDNQGNIPDGVLTVEAIPESVKQEIESIPKDIQRRLGDGTFIKLFLEYLPQIIALIKMFSTPTAPVVPA